MEGQFDSLAMSIPEDTDTMTSSKALYDTYEQLLGRIPSFLIYQGQV